MEKQFNAHHLEGQQTSGPTPDTHPVQLRKGHLWISAAIAREVFSGARQSYADFNSQTGLLLLSPIDNQVFKLVHPECSLLMLKDRNLAGDQSISLQELLIDHDLDDRDRTVGYEVKTGKKVLMVKLKEESS